MTYSCVVWEYLLLFPFSMPRWGASLEGERMTALVYVLIGCGVCAVVIGAMLLSCWTEEITEAEFYALKNEQWKRNQDEKENINEKY